MTLRLMLKELANPLALCLILILLAALSRRPKVCRLLCIAAGCILLFLSTPKVSDLLMESLESKYNSPKLTDVSPEAAIVVLGGMLRLPGGRHSDAELTDASDRLRCAAQLYHLGKAPLIVISGGSDTAQSESQVAKSVLIEWGIPSNAIQTEEAARTTNQNASFSYQLLKREGIGRVILVTSASHMPRAVAAFRGVGLSVVPVPSDFRTGWRQRPFPLDYVPTPSALETASIAVREWLGMKFYQTMGWT
jgi:uncharacterized SAM-binding protein YcdF (DUF218 family)